MLLVGTHDPSFSRTSLIAEGLRLHGLEVTPCVEPAWGGTADRVAAARRGLGNPMLLRRLAGSYARLARRVKSLAPKPQVLLVGYPGQLDVLVLRTLMPRATIVLDAFVSIDETLEDRAIGSPTGPTRRAARMLDRLAFRLADRVIVDTAAHGRRLAVRYGLDLTRAIVVPVGARDWGLEVGDWGLGTGDSGLGDGDERGTASGPATDEASALDPGDDQEVSTGRGHGRGTSPRATDEGLEHPLPIAQPPTPRTHHPAPLRVLYFGGFIPLHGVATIVEAARRIPSTAGIHVDLVGDGQHADPVERMLAETPLPHVRLLRTWMSEERLVAEHLRSADVALGIFARRPKAMDVVPAKVYLAMACGLPVVTADSPAVREEVLDLFPADPPPLVVCPPGDPDALARCLLALRDDPTRRQQVGAAARRAFETRFRPERIVEPLLEVLGTGG